MESCLPFVSYAQNFEDVMLWRALKHIEKGVYVDVGAQHPIIDSVSKAFYERGWRGIHIEPVPHYAELLRKDRPDETVLQVALADCEGTLELNVIPDTGLSTAVDAYAQHHQLDRGYELNRIQVPVLTLKSALKSLEGKDVHWLKIDVEGFEEQVLRGWDSQILRPWVMVVEATVPNSPETSYASWDPILTAANYKFVYFDGLNRFYVANEHAELAEAFSCPPNVFDGVELSGLASWGLCRGLIVAHQTREEALHTQNARLVTELNSAGEVHAQLQAHAQWLQNVWDAAKQRVEELSQLTAQQGVDLQAAREHESRLQAHAQWLQNEWDAAKQRVEELSQLTAQQGVDLQAAREHESRLQAHAQWLQNEWDAAKAKIDELNHSSHHWWTIADAYNKELQAVYAGKSWRITWPLRRANQAAKWVLMLHKRTVRWLLRLPASLLSFTVRSGLIGGSGTSSPTSCPAEPGTSAEQSAEVTSLQIMQTELPKSLSPHAARIYADLQKDLAVRKS
jgi:FkbM family methyltransferase